MRETTNAQLNTNFDQNGNKIQFSKHRQNRKLMATYLELGTMINTMNPKVVPCFHVFVMKWVCLVFQKLDTQYPLIIFKTVFSWTQMNKMPFQACTSFLGEAISYIGWITAYFWSWNLLIGLHCTTMRPTRTNAQPWLSLHRIFCWIKSPKLNKENVIESNKNMVVH